MVVSFVAVSAPQFVVGILLLYVFAVNLGWFPIGGYGTFAHLVLPSLTLGILGAGWYARMMRSSMIDVLRQGYMRTAKAKGLKPGVVLFVHALPNAILPIVAMIGIDIGIFMSGIVVVESVFGWPGIGQLAWQAIQRIDIPIILAEVTLVAAGIVVGNLLADIAASLIDPRVIRLASCPGSGDRTTPGWEAQGMWSRFTWPQSLRRPCPTLAAATAERARSRGGEMVVARMTSRRFDARSGHRL
jgi:peptide/nickel transport system permease protein